LRNAFEVRAAWIVGFVLPLLEVLRRRTHFHPIFSYIDDFIAGGLLLWAAYLAHRRKRHAKAMLCASWGILAGGLYHSFFGQMESGAAIDVSGVRSLYVIFIKGLLLGTAIAALTLSVRRFSCDSAQ
jgi:hypothetical protein